MITKTEILQGVVVSLNLSGQLDEPWVLFKVLVAQKESSVKLDDLVQSQLVLRHGAIQAAGCSNYLKCRGDKKS